ncbi:MAG TPA: DUF1552 domain-containing protein [Planctomycetaceae bacterium]|jgi:hypothetical protein
MNLNADENTANAFPSRHALSRRNFLRGMGAAAIALPAFESLRPLSLLAGETSAAGQLAVTASGAPLRSAFVFFPNGAIPSAWWPKTDGTDFEWSRTLQPLEAHKNFVQIMGGLDHRNAEAGPDGAGDHARGGGTFLTGVRLKKSSSDIRAGISIDQVMAREIASSTRFPSLELSCDASRQSGACDSGYACAYQFNLSWRSATTPMIPEANPRLVFERLFGPGAPGERRANLARRQQEQKSVLDFVREDAKSMQRRLNAKDVDKLDQYLTGVRDIEARIAKAEKFGATQDPAIDTPVGIPPSYSEYVELMYDMLILAFQSDSTRVGTLLLAHDGSNRSFEDIGITEGHHDLSHHQNRADWIQKVAEIDLWYTRQFATFLDKLNKVSDVDGNSLLHNSMIVYGGGNADANRHSHDNLPFVLAGAGGGTLKTGRFVKHGGKPASNLFLSLADRMGLPPVEKFGDSTGRLENI